MPAVTRAYDRYVTQRLRGVLYFVTLTGLWTFGCYIVLRAGGLTQKNFKQWQGALGPTPLETVQIWIANLGIGMHFLMGIVLVTAWPILFSAKIRQHRPAVHRWTGRVYVTAGGLAGLGGLTYILSHGAMDLYQNIAFGIWGTLMATTAVLTYLKARARNFAAHRKWAIRLFALVLGSWLFDLEYRTWKLMTGGIGIGADGRGWFDYLADYLFYVPNIIVAEYYIRRKGRAGGFMTSFATPLLLAASSLLLAFAFWATSISAEGKFGRQLISAFVRPGT